MSYRTIQNINNSDYSAFPRVVQPDQCWACQSDGKYSTFPPYYQLGPSPYPVCPFYNYTLPDYPYSPTKPDCNVNINVQYWYGAYNKPGCG